MSIQNPYDLPNGFIPPDLPLEEKIRMDARNGLVDISSYHVRVFDMEKDTDRKQYEETMTELYAKIQASRAVIWHNDKEILHNKDGSTSWHKYLEWSDYVKPELSKETESTNNQSLS